MIPQVELCGRENLLPDLIVMPAPCYLLSSSALPLLVLILPLIRFLHSWCFSNLASMLFHLFNLLAACHTYLIFYFQKLFTYMVPCKCWSVSNISFAECKVFPEMIILHLKRQCFHSDDSLFIHQFESSLTDSLLLSSGNQSHSVWTAVNKCWNSLQYLPGCTMRQAGAKFWVRCLWSAALQCTCRISSGSINSISKQSLSLNEQEELVIQPAYHCFIYLCINSFYFQSHIFSFPCFYNVLSENIYLTTKHVFT